MQNSKLVCYIVLFLTLRRNFSALISNRRCVASVQNPMSELKRMQSSDCRVTTATETEIKKHPPKTKQKQLSSSAARRWDTDRGTKDFCKRCQAAGKALLRLQIAHALLTGQPLAMQKTLKRKAEKDLFFITAGPFKSFQVRVLLFIPAL